MTHASYDAPPRRSSGAPPRSKRKLIIAVVVAPALCLIGITSAQATTGTVLVKGWSTITSIACPTSTACVVTGQNAAGTGDKAAVVRVRNGSYKLWSGTLKSYSPLYSLSCATKTTCIGVGTDILATVNVSTGAITKQALTVPKNYMDALGTISCTPKFCLAGGSVSQQEIGKALLLKISPAGKVLATMHPAGTGIGSISCENTTTCMAAIANAGKPEHIDPIVNGKVKTGGTIPASDFLDQLACHGTKSCSAVGGTIKSGKETASLYWQVNPATGKISKKINLGTVYGFALACPKTAACDIVGYNMSTKAVPVIEKMTGSKGKLLGYSYLTEPFDTIACAPATAYCFAAGPDSSGTTVRSEVTKF